MSRSDRRRSQSATFRLPAPALFFPVLLLFCVTPLATSGGAWAVAFVVPVLALAWVIVTRTKATPSSVTAYGLLGAKKMPWTELAGLEFKDARWAIAVGLDGRRVRLPMVRPRDLPRLAAVSGGSLRLGPDAPADDATGEAAVDVGAVDDSAVVDGAAGGSAVGGGAVSPGAVGDHTDERPVDNDATEDRSGTEADATVSTPAHGEATPAARQAVPLGRHGHAAEEPGPAATAAARTTGNAESTGTGTTDATQAPAPAEPLARPIS